MMRHLAAMAALLAMASVAAAAPANDVTVLTKQLEAFLDGASRGDAAAHDRFWDDDLIYTGSGGLRVGKADILRDVRATPPPKPDDPRTVFAAQDVRVHLYGNMAVVAFRLIGTTTGRDGTARVARFLNSGTFRKRNGEWRAVSWQATRLPRSESDARQEVTAARAAFEAALRGPDTAKLAALADTGFVWTDAGGEQWTRARLIQDLGSGKMRYGFETDGVDVLVRGDAAVVHGRTAPAPSGLRARYTLTLVNQDGEWKALAMHVTRP